MTNKNCTSEHYLLPIVQAPTSKPSQL